MKKLTKRSIAMLLTLCMVVSMFGTAAVFGASASSFNDISKTHWAYKYVDDVVSKGHFSGTSSTTFGPEVSMTRAMFVTVLSNVEGATVNNNATTAFTDVPSGEWYTGAIAWAAENDIVKGITDTTFEPNTPITREQMASLIVRYADYAEMTLGTSNSAVTFTDEAAISDYAKDAVKACQRAGLISGMGDGTFAPKGTATRAQVAAMISLLEGGPEEDEEDEDGVYTITFNSNGGSSVSSVKVNEGEKVKKPTNPTRSGYSFDAWYSDKDLKEKYDFNTEVTKSFTLYAGWNVVSSGGSGGGTRSYTVSFTLDDINALKSFSMGSKEITFQADGSGGGTASETFTATTHAISYEYNDGYYIDSITAGSNALTSDSLRVSGSTQVTIVTKNDAPKIASGKDSAIVEKETKVEDLSTFTGAGMTPESMTLNSTVAYGDGANDKVKIVVDVDPDGLQLLASDGTNWYDIVESGWGPEEGFVIPASYNATTPVFVIPYGTADEYTVTMCVIDADTNKIIAKDTFKIIAIDKPEAGVYNVRTDAQLQAAIAAGDATTINLMDNFSVASTLTLNDAVTVNGYGRTITSSANPAVRIGASEVAIDNLNLDVTGAIGIRVLGDSYVYTDDTTIASDVVISNVTVSGATDASIEVNASKVTVEGDIVIDAPIKLLGYIDHKELTIKEGATIQFEDEDADAPAIYILEAYNGEQKYVVDNAGVIKSMAPVGKGMNYYTQANILPPVAVRPHEGAATQYAALYTAAGLDIQITGTDVAIDATSFNYSANVAPIVNAEQGAAFVGLIFDTPVDAVAVRRTIGDTSSTYTLKAYGDNTPHGVAAYSGSYLGYFTVAEYDANDDTYYAVDAQWQISLEFLDANGKVISSEDFTVTVTATPAPPAAPLTEPGTPTEGDGE